MLNLSTKIQRWVVKELNLSLPPRFFCDHGFTDRCEEHNPNHLSSTRGIRTPIHLGLSQVALPNWRSVPSLISVPDRIRTGDLLRDRQASTPLLHENSSCVITRDVFFAFARQPRQEHLTRMGGRNVDASRISDPRGAML